MGTGRKGNDVLKVPGRNQTGVGAVKAAGSP